MEIVAALFVESINFRQVPGPSTRIDITGAYFSVPVAEFPFRLDPHLVVLLRCAPGDPGQGTLQTVFLRDGEEVGRNRQEFAIEPGKFGYRLVRGELEFDGPSTVEAHCSTGDGPTIIVPLSVFAST